MVLMTSFVYQAESFLRRVEAAVFARNQSTGVPRLQTHAGSKMMRIMVMNLVMVIKRIMMIM